MTIRSRALALALMALIACHKPRPPRPLRFGGLDVQWRSFRFEHAIEVLTLDSGLTVALLPDRRTNLVTVDVRYQVGAAEDPDGRAGLAHFVEHLLFLIRARVDGPTLSDELGAAALEHNAWTTWDETHFTATAMAERFDDLLRLEARRMAATCEQLDAALFARERDVVLEEDAQRHDPTATLREELAAAIWGAAHPYARPIGSRQIADVSQAEACAFVAAHYAPDRAILVVTGRFDPEQATRMIKAKFGAITGQASAERVAVAPPKLDGQRTEHVADVDQATAVVFFEAPRWGDQDAPRGEAIAAYLAAFLADGADDLDWVTATSVSRFGGSRAPVLAVTASVSDPARLDDAVALIHDSVAKLTEQSVVDRMLPGVRGRLRALYAAGYEQFLGRGALIADYLQYTDHRLFFGSDLVELDTLSAAEIAPHVRQHLDREHSAVALIRPSGAPAQRLRAKVAASEREHDLQPWRIAVDPLEATRPLISETSRITAEVRELELGNGLRVLLAPAEHSLMIDARLVFGVGSSADPADRRGLAAQAAALLGPDFDRRYRRGEISMLEFAFDLGTSLDTAVDERSTTFSASGLAVYADWHVWRLFWQLDAGIYADDRIDAMHRQVARMAAGPAAPEVDAASARLRERLFGVGHPYASPPDDGAGRAAIVRADLDRFRDRHYRAHDATLIISGGFDADAMQAEIEELFGAWPNAAPPKVAAVPAIDPARGPTWIVEHDDARVQVGATIAFAIRSDRGDDGAARQVLQAMLADRVRVVRDGLGASYGVSVQYGGGLGGAVLTLAGELDPDRAGKALSALRAEIARIRDQPDQVVDDFVRARRRALGIALADAAGAIDLADELQRTVVDGLPIGYLSSLATAIAATTPAQVTALARRDLDATRMVVLLRGPSALVDAAVIAAGGADPQVIEPPRPGSPPAAPPAGSGR